MKRQAAKPCPTPDKKAHRSLEAASYHARDLARHTNQRGEVQEPLYGYRCVCHRWHVTRDPLPPTGRTPNEVLVDWSRELQEWAIHG